MLIQIWYDFLIKFFILCCVPGFIQTNNFEGNSLFYSYFSSEIRFSKEEIFNNLSLPHNSLSSVMWVYVLYVLCTCTSVLYVLCMYYVYFVCVCVFYVCGVVRCVCAHFVCALYKEWFFNKILK